MILRDMLPLCGEKSIPMATPTATPAISPSMRRPLPFTHSELFAVCMIEIDLERPSAADDPHQNCDDRNHEENVNQPAGAEADESNRPGDDQDYGNKI